MREDSDTTVIVCRQDFAENRVLYTYGRHAKELKNDGKTFLGPVFESMIEQAGIVDDAEEVGLLVHIRVRPKPNDDRWYQIDFVMQDDSMAYYSNFDGRLPAEMVHVVPLSGGLPQVMFIAVEALDEVAYAHAVDAKLFEENNEMGLPRTKPRCETSVWKLISQLSQRTMMERSILLSRRLKIVRKRSLCPVQPAALPVENKSRSIHELIYRFYREQPWNRSRTQNSLRTVSFTNSANSLTTVVRLYSLLA